MYSSCSHQHVLSLPPLRIKIQLTQFHNHDFLVTHCFSEFFLNMYTSQLNEVSFCADWIPFSFLPSFSLASASNCGTDLPLFTNAHVGPGTHFQLGFYQWVGSSRGISKNQINKP